MNSVAGLLKQFFRDLPDPLLSHDHYRGFIDAASEFKPSMIDCAHGDDREKRRN